MAPRKADALSSLRSAPVKSCPEPFDTLDNQNIIKILRYQSIDKCQALLYGALIPLF